ncbi:hypothetical protein A3715_33420 [Oleiphilus sp. HI0009]|nr:hypothetical protein A3715_10220 [Oleiphilus sp. HI0009]KZX82745.1 hypothetical protein A3715_33420 [Oleiphilus sp. HI0009]
MRNSEEAYKESGEKTAKAINEHDYSRTQFEKDYFRKMLNLEDGLDRSRAQSIFQKAYRDKRKV